MKYERPKLVLLMPAIDAIQAITAKRSNYTVVEIGEENEKFSVYEDWEN